MDEEAARKQPDFLPGQKLDDLSVDEIDRIIALLREEIARLEAARERKSAHLDAAQALFSPRKNP